MKTKLAALLVIVSLVFAVSASTSVHAEEDLVIKPLVHGVGN